LASTLAVRSFYLLIRKWRRTFRFKGFNLREKRKSFYLFGKLSFKYFYFFNYFFLIYFRRRQRRRSYKGFFYRLNVVETYRRRKRENFRYVRIRIVKFFFVFLSYKQFRRLARQAKLQSGVFEHNYLLFLEGRLVNFLYRTGFMDHYFNLFII